MSSFVAIDVETANADMASICQVGLVSILNGKEISRKESLVDPEDFFDPINSSIHGITPETVLGQPTFKEVHDWMMQELDGSVVVSHSHFDRVSISRACVKRGLRAPDCVWLDSLMVARRAWPEFSESGYGLQSLAKKLGLAFDHHYALDDAWVASQIVLRALSKSNESLEWWLSRVKRPVSDAPDSKGRFARDGSPDGKLFGEVVAFTGALAVPRKEAAEIASRAGCQIVDSVNKKTTILVVGDQDIKRLAPGETRSAKHRKAEDLIKNGWSIRIIGESDFMAAVSPE